MYRNDGARHVEGTDKVVPDVTEECKKTPKVSFWTKLEGEWRKLEKKMWGATAI